MVSKKNYSEKIQKIRPQSQRFSIRKFTVGVASVMIGLIFMGVNGQTVKGDNLTSPEVLQKDVMITENENGGDRAVSKTSYNKY
ncbi:MAG: YSIRK-type signal peptide-containing protein [Lactobacillus sp.]|nr:YSIRK-type signal peptide-containing protein [Lactobacillus sp.]